MDVGYYAAPAFADIDGDGDLDSFIGNKDGNIEYYKNTGSASSPTFTEQTGTDNNPFDGVDVGYSAAPAFTDIDNDGDLDYFIGNYDGNIKYYQNTGNASSPVFTEDTDNNPFDGVDVGYNAAPTNPADLTGDKKADVFVGDRDGTIHYFLNTGDVTVVKLTDFTAKHINGNIFIEWQTATEIETAGFNIFRADSENGQYSKITETFIPNTGGAIIGASYSFTDTTAKNGSTYFYKLEEIENNSTTHFYDMNPVKVRNSEPETNPLDINKDGSFNVGDVVFLLQKLTGMK
ncbi:hypothetical protein GMMP15_470001 [Candidatus Magnetomoraceae bacterium gMMP-15]